MFGVMTPWIYTLSYYFSILLLGLWRGIKGIKSIVTEKTERKNAEIRAAPPHFESKVWENIGFDHSEDRNELDVSATAGELRHGEVKCCGNTTNMRNIAPIRF